MASMTALAVPSEQGGVTGWLLELVDTRVVRMPLGRFALLTSAGSLIWNTALVVLGVAAVVVAVGWFVFRTVSGTLDRPRTAGSDLPVDERDQA